MTRMPPEQYEESVKTLKPRVFVKGKRVESIVYFEHEKNIVKRTLNLKEK